MTKLNSEVVRGAALALETTKRLAELFADLGFEADAGLSLIRKGILTPDDLGRVLSRKFFGRPVSLLKTVGVHITCQTAYTIGTCLEAIEPEVERTVARRNWVRLLREEEHVQSSWNDELEAPSDAYLLPIRRSITVNAARRLCTLRHYQPLSATPMLWTMAHLATKRTISLNTLRNVGIYTLTRNPDYLHDAHEVKRMAAEEGDDSRSTSEWFVTDNGLFFLPCGHSYLPGDGKGTYANQMATDRQRNYLLVRRNH